MRLIPNYQDRRVWRTIWVCHLVAWHLQGLSPVEILWNPDIHYDHYPERWIIFLIKLNSWLVQSHLKTMSAIFFPIFMSGKKDSNWYLKIPPSGKSSWKPLNISYNSLSSYLENTKFASLSLTSSCYPLWFTIHCQSSRVSPDFPSSSGVMLTASSLILDPLKM